MKLCRKKIVLAVLAVVMCLFWGGCEEPPARKIELAPTIELGTTIGSLVEVFSLSPIHVEGIALVGGLKGTGSRECPPRIRDYLDKYIRQQLAGERVNVDNLINSLNTAVVHVKGYMPTGISDEPYFDVKVTALAGTQTTSLEGGDLWGVDLKKAGRLGVAFKILATAEGAVFIDTIEGGQKDKKTGYVLAGGMVIDDYKLSLVLRHPDYKTASAIRNRLWDLFGDDIAKAISPSEVELKVPAKYAKQKQRFISIVQATYLKQNQQIIQERIKTAILDLAVSENKAESEIAVEAIGRQSLEMLSALLNSSNEEVRLRAGRCMLNLGSDRGLRTLRKIAMDENSDYRIEALEAIAGSASYNDATSVSRRLLRDKDFDVRIAAYEQLRKLDDISISQKLIGDKFYLEQIAQTRQKSIFVARSGQPRVVLFGAPIFCRDNIFVQSGDGNITINAPAGQKYVSVMRRHPTRAGTIIKLKSSFKLSDIIRTLGESAVVKDEVERRIRPGMAVSYAELIAVLKQLSDKGAVNVEFRAGDLPKIR